MVVRDRKSADFCSAQGLTNCRAAPDIVLDLPKLLGIPASPVDAVAPYALVCLRAHPDVYGGYALTETREQGLAAALDTICDRHGLRIVFLPFQDNSEQGVIDNDLHRSVAARMKRSDLVEIRSWSADFGQIIREFQHSSMVIGMRLHAVILAHACGRPCAVMAYDRKVAEFAAQTGMSTMIPPELLDHSSAVAELLERCVAGAGSGAQRIASDWDSLRL